MILSAPKLLHGQDPSTLLDQYVSLALQGRIDIAIQKLQQAPPESLQPLERELLHQANGRFLKRSEELSPLTGEPLVDGIVSAYRNYWIDRLTNLDAFDPEERLVERLNAVLETTVSEHWLAQSADTFEQLAQALTRRGFFFLETGGPPMRELIIWKTQRPTNYTVVLTDETLKVDLRYARGFVSRGWKDFASLGIVSTSGWIENGILYCDAGFYQPASEEFRISFLKHEGRHLADAMRFPGLDTTTLEYRAKLTELAFAEDTLPRLLSRFSKRRADNPESPHGQANYRVARDLAAALPVADSGNELPDWSRVSRSQVHAAARVLLERNTNALQEPAPD